MLLNHSQEWFFCAHFLCGGDCIGLLDEVYLEIERRVQAANNEISSVGQKDIEQFYSQGKPRRYRRTGKYGRSFEVTPVNGGRGRYSFTMRLNVTDYSPAGLTGQQIYEGIQSNQYRIKGKPNTWHTALKHLYQILNKNLS